MTDQQVFLSVGILLLFNGIPFAAIFIMLSWLKSDIKDFKKDLSDRIDKVG